MSETREKLLALIKKESSECGLWAAGMLDEFAVAPELQKLSGPDALKIVAMAMRNEAGKLLADAPPENLFIEVGKLCAEVEELRAQMRTVR